MKRSFPKQMLTYFKSFEVAISFIRTECILFYFWWLVRVTLVVDWLFLPQNFGPVSRSVERDRVRDEPPGETFTTWYYLFCMNTSILKMYAWFNCLFNIFNIRVVNRQNGGIFLWLQSNRYWRYFSITFLNPYFFIHGIYQTFESFHLFVSCVILKIDMIIVCFSLGSWCVGLVQ